MNTLQKLKRIGKIGIVAMALVVASCSDDDDNGGGGGTPDGYFLTAKVDGNNYSNSEFFEPSVIMQGNMLMIQSSNNSGDAFQIQIPNYNGVGTYNSGNNDLTQGYINYSDMLTIPNMVSYTSVRGTGQVIITEVSDTEIEGTFTATAIENVENSTNDVAITDGKFRVEIPQS
ncbi:MAG TPA: hypothetical protein VGB44_10105 [Flavobacterium sp.]|jgi:hypothetical protein